MSILSKTWLKSWLTHPNLEFNVPNLKGNIKIVDTIMERYRDGKIPIEKFELLDCEGSTHGLTLIDKWIDIALQNGAKDLVIKVASVSLPIFTILAAKSLRELVLESCNTLMPISLSSGFGVSSCNSLRKLSLNKIELLNLQNIKSVSISTRRNLYVKVRALTLEHLSYSGYLSNNLDVECPNLESLDLSYTPEVNVLNVDILCQDEECPTFVDALLRSCHPRRLNLHSSIKMITCFIRRLMYMKNSSLSLSQLVEMEAFDAKKQSLQLRSGELLISNPTERKKVFFLLDWRCNYF
ncbi:hypothetical protein T459_22661 [Capsicum annuum]|uniref:FBD domain-containing protein n=1 Tax=Capsicum annuum TaxID=4072 RepID=A0A2G2YQ42_CAPAN|nr:hypothetical protein T459_22661 [Capsicum annuum]